MFQESKVLRVRKLQTHQTRQRGRYKMTNPQLSKENFKAKEKLVAGPR
jgi:hypothetical protein